MSTSTSTFSQNPDHDYVTEIVQLYETTGNQGGRGYGQTGPTYELGTGEVPLTESLGAVYQIDVYEIVETTTAGRTIHQLRGPVASSTTTVLSGISGNNQAKMGVSSFLIIMMLLFNTIFGL
ncbi:hypothetical protein KGF54_004658 [Candida jiufengensis]|uniref:uncharacterized protein n=1 Tax=Candida jiufengensis TaxID=497108 RepID=UPI002225333D|nr:uncharacterized protein KGF54_004658 [Candida jiufengensis]KAI5951584.1 hypothetical protein KGF54_004658 [Candida jiufengensis]